MAIVKVNRSGKSYPIYKENNADEQIGTLYNNELLHGNLHGKEIPPAILIRQFLSVRVMAHWRTVGLLPVKVTRYWQTISVPLPSLLKNQQ